MNQSELEANTCNRRQARENACEREQVATDWFEFYSWLVEKVARKVLTNHRAKWGKTKAKHELLTTLNWKPLYT